MSARPDYYGHRDFRDHHVANGDPGKLRTLIRAVLDLRARIREAS